jgi:hypothetical protein
MAFTQHLSLKAEDFFLINNDFLIETAAKIDPEAFQRRKGFRKVGVRPLGSPVTPPYPAKLDLCMTRFFEQLGDLNKQEQEHSDIGSFIHLHLARIHPFEDCKIGRAHV